jgi:hypothetical protein
MNIHSTRIGTTLRQAAGLTALALGLGLALTSGADPATAASQSANPLSSETQRADAAVDRAVTHVHAGRYGKAKKDLESARTHTVNANKLAFSLIGAPPTDPESDDPPGPPAVLKALRLDQRVTTRLVPLYDGMTRPGVVLKLRLAVGGAQTQRDVIVDKVVALPPEGAGADYADGLADSLGLFTREVNTLQSAVNTFTLTDPARVGLSNALDRARATKDKMDAAFGGGERRVP